MYKRQVIVGSSFLTIFAGEDITLLCKVRGLKVEVNWTKNGLPLPKNDSNTLGDSSTLVISNIGSDDSGDYSCQARNPAGSSSSTVKIRVAGRVILFSPKKWLKKIWAQQGH